MRCADMKRHKRKRMKKLDVERGLALLMSAINNDSFGLSFLFLFVAVAMVRRNIWYSFRSSFIDFIVKLDLIVNSWYVII